jgi:hypothetical protein
MQFNFFDWIRSGVKRSVILGVHDAMEALGNPSDDDARERLVALLPPAQADASQPVLASTNRRKRLGRSLRDSESSQE